MYGEFHGIFAPMMLRDACGIFPRFLWKTEPWHGMKSWNGGIIDGNHGTVELMMEVMDGGIIDGYRLYGYPNHETYNAYIVTRLSAFLTLTVEVDTFPATLES